MEDQNLNPISNWLKKLQQESWNLELLVSGFSIFLLALAIEEMPDGFNYVQEHMGSDTFSAMGLLFMLFSYLGIHVLFINLIFHLMIRGFWIGAIGLSSVQKKASIDSLGYGTFFKEKLKSKLIPIEELILKLDDFASVVFSFSFLLVFMILSGITFVFILSVFGFLLETFLPDKISIGIIMTILVLSLFYMVDTLTLGLLKRNNFVAKIYYPIYLMSSTLSFSFLYKSLYYNLISRFSKWKIGLVLGVYLFLVVMYPFNKLDYFPFYPDKQPENVMLNAQYDDLRFEKTYVKNISIPSRQISTPFMPLFIRYDAEDNDLIRKNCTDYEPSKKSTFVTGIKIGADGFRLGDADIEEEDPGKLLACLQSIYQISIDDSLYQHLDFNFYTHPSNREKGILSMINVQELAPGKHSIRFEKLEERKDSMYFDLKATVPFWTH